MRRLAVALSLACLAVLALSPQAQGFGFNNFDITYLDEKGDPAQAGTHPFSMTTTFGTDMDVKFIPEGWLKDLFVETTTGLVGDTDAYPRCTTLQFLEKDPATSEPLCPEDSQVGIAAISIQNAGEWQTFPMFNLTPPPGTLIRLGFLVIGQEKVFFDVRLSEEAPFNGIGSSRYTAQLLDVFGGKVQLWGEPSDEGHDELRGKCGGQSAILPPGEVSFEFQKTGKFCGIDDISEPFLTMPTDCSAPLPARYEAFSWEGAFDEGTTHTHDALGNDAPLTGCGKLLFRPSIEAAPTSLAAASPSGLDFALEVDDEGLTSLGGTRHSAIRKAVITLPEGMTANPSVAEGLEVCSQADLARERLHSLPGQGCPQASKLGTLEVETPLLEESIKGSLYIAEPYQNEFGSLIAFYMVFRNEQLGILFKQSLKGEPDPRTGQLVTIAEGIPQTAVFSRLTLHLREGGRSPLITPPLCGTHEATAELYPYSGGAPHTASSSFEILAGPGGGPCPPGGTPPFDPGFAAGSQNNAAGSSSTFSMRLTRRDADQDLTRFDATLPPGVGAILAGVGKCGDQQIAQAKARSGKAEQQSPSCPPGSRIGTVIGGAGAGSQLTYVRGSLYLAGPLGKAPLSVVAIVPAVAGPFDVGTVVVRQALDVDPRTAQASVDGASSDPLPHILAGVPLVVRDVHVHADRPSFTYNPTSCDPFATQASIWGGGADPFGRGDDAPVARQSPFRAADCSRLGFKPRLSLRLKGGTRRGDFPAFRFLYRPRPGDANLSRLALRFPRSEFVEQGHFRTICTRVQFAAGAGHGTQCPKASVYGKVRVLTPVLEGPFEGPVFLRSSNHNLPDVVLALRGPPGLEVEVEVVSRIDSIRGQLRAIAEATPDVPVSKVILEMQGGQKGLFVNSTNLCAAPHRAKLLLRAQNEKRRRARPPLKVSCPTKGR